MVKSSFKNQKSIKFGLLLFGIITVIIVFGVLQGKKTSNSLLPSNSFPSEVPMYPNATFVKQEYIPACPGEQAVCDTESYLWESQGELNKIIQWYAEDMSQSGWQLTGGAGAEGVNRFGRYSNGKLSYWLTVFLLGPTGPVGIELRGPLSF